MMIPEKKAARDKARMQRAMEALAQRFPGCAIALLIAPFDAPPGSRVNYIGNGQRDDVRVMLKELLAQWEGRLQEPGSLQ